MAEVIEKQGADITDDDMAWPLEESSKIQQFFAGTSVFLTGATGFLGKLMLEKLLRTCTEIEKVYILVREKKGVSVEKRLEELFNMVVFDPLKRKNPKFAFKIIVFTGDCALPDLGLNNEDKQELIDNVSCVFHCAATVRFDQKIRTAAYINVRATIDLLALAKQMKKLKVFDPLKRKNPKFAAKIIVLTGDCVLPDLGLNNEDKQELIDNVSCVFHCAATVRFDQKIRTAAYINVRATMDLLALAKQMKKLKSFVYVSTAYSNCVRLEINEEFYQPTITGDNLLKLVEMFDDDMLDKIIPPLIGKWPNTYVFTKSVAEDVVKTQSEGLNIAVIRPSIVTGSMNEPLSGWIDNVYAATGVFLGGALGLIRTIHGNKHCLADMVPADYVVNCTIAAAWDVGTTNLNKKISNHDGTDKQNQDNSNIPTVYNYVCSPQKPITWGQTLEVLERNLKQLPSTLQVWHYCFRMNSNYYIHYLYLIFLHRLPAYIVDFVARCIGKKPMMVKGYQKIEKFLDVVGYFARRSWRFQNNNVQALWKKLNVDDQKFFEFDLDTFDWEAYFYAYSRGSRMYLLKDPLDTIPQGRVKHLKLLIAHYVLVGLLLLGLFKMLLMIWSVIF